METTEKKVEVRNVINKYSGIKKSTDDSPEKTLGGIYKLILPGSILLVMAGFIATFLLADYDGIIPFLRENSTDRLLFILLGITTIFVLFRAYQSIYLANIDYPTIKKLRRDYVTFAFVVIIFISFDILMARYAQITYVYLFYALVTFIAFINFWGLFSTRLKKQEDEIDYICEKKIQFINTVVFFILIILFLSIAFLRQFNVSVAWVYISLSSCIWVLLLLNILHSHELTYLPKIILSNDDDNEDNGHKLKIYRANKEDADEIAKTIIKEFKYIYSYIFDTDDDAVLTHILRQLICSCSGFGFMGYMNFYHIRRIDNGKDVGLIKIDTLHPCYLYKFAEAFSLPYIVFRQFGIGKMFSIYRRSKKIMEGQPKPQNKTEFELTYFVIHEPYKRQGYGTQAMNLLINALLRHKTNNIDCTKLLLLVREKNEGARKLFEKCLGGKEHEPSDPFSENETIGKGIVLQFL